MRGPQSCCQFSIWLALVLPGCALIDGLSGDDQSIEYPESGFTGLNMLAPNLGEATLDTEYSVRAELGGQASLRIVVRNVPGEVVFGRFSDIGTGWSTSDDGGMTTTLVALTGRGSPDIGCTLVADNKSGETSGGDIVIEYFENGDLTTTFSRTVSVAPFP